ncbi:cysteine hydrolase family protein [Phytomonospora endophytica]|uniref:Nicotinamidase-related amidase n=1 Tax=Phytomonospora endophytica TaxID=714109 RepID=A0A841FNG6_9ACTN|nr:isochorismatase family cysteine hydrolase [Phytomonospora endophytica]MBB6034139.1 nicotinamidase-related amidase [Phytomonospora endophytica]GIG66531.1 isochorismatase [Phytomonospora endophytica]
MAHRPALLIIDMQTALLTRSRAHDLDATVAVVAGLRERADAAGVPVIALQQWGEKLPQGAPGHEFVEALTPRVEDVVIAKRSADPFIDTTLKATLDALGVTEVLVTGFATEFCVESAARASLGHGYDVVLVADGHTTMEREDTDEYISAARSIAHHNQIFGIIEYPGRSVRVLPSSEVDFSSP